jgi:hypothetical protein
MAARSRGPDSAAPRLVRSSRARRGRLPAYYKTLDAPCTLLRSSCSKHPADPRRLRDLWGALQMGRNFRKLEPVCSATSTSCSRAAPVTC